MCMYYTVCVYIYIYIYKHGIAFEIVSRGVFFFKQDPFRKNPILECDYITSNNDSLWPIRIISIWNAGLSHFKIAMRSVRKAVIITTSSALPVSPAIHSHQCAPTFYTLMLKHASDFWGFELLTCLLSRKIMSYKFRGPQSISVFEIMEALL